MDDSQVLYLGRWVSRAFFKAFVYNKSDKKLVRNYDEYCQAIASGLWQAEPYSVLKEEDIADELIQEGTTDSPIPSIIEMELEETKVVDIKPNKGRACLNQKKV